MDLVKAVELLEPGPLDQASGKWSGKDGWPGSNRVGDGSSPFGEVERLRLK